MKNIWIYDFEVSAYDWLFVAKEIRQGTENYVIVHNQPDVVRAFLETECPILGGFNVKHYDSYILKGVLADYTPEEIKQINDFIIGGGNGFDIDIPYSGIKVDQFDLMDDCQVGLSLKAIEAHLGMDIQETEVDFDLDRPWTNDELQLMIKYCKADVDATCKLYNLRRSYLQNKIELGKAKNLSPEKALYMTNAKLTAVYLDAEKREWNDEREYRYPETLLKEYIPQEVFDFFERLHDKDLTDDEVFSSKLNIEVGGCPVTIGYGGIHGAIPQYKETSTDKRSIRNKDVASYYPHQMVLNGYCSRNIPNPELYKQTILKRVAAKKSGDKVTANALKLVLDVLGSSIKNPLNLTKGVI